MCNWGDVTLRKKLAIDVCLLPYRRLWFITMLLYVKHEPALLIKNLGNLICTRDHSFLSCKYHSPDRSEGMKNYNLGLSKVHCKLLVGAKLTTSHEVAL